jgi:hypothetical protein
LINALKPYGAGGIAAQRWYDVAIEATNLQRSSGASRPLLFDRPGGAPTFSSGDLDVNGNEWGLKASLAILFGAGGNIETTYIGLNEWEDSRRIAVTPPGPLTAFSFDAAGTQIAFDEFTQATSLGIDARSAFHSTELNYRRRWVGPYGRFQGSWVWGVRYFDVDESFAFSANGPDTFYARTLTRNAVTGGQIGGDLWWNLIPGVNLGVEYKTGLFGLVAEQETLLTSRTGAVTNYAFHEEADDVETTTMTEISAMLVYRLTYSWALRGSYTLINIRDMALAATNFNPSTGPIDPIIGQSSAFAGREVSINNSERYRVQGWTFGIEYIW